MARKLIIGLCLINLFFPYSNIFAEGVTPTPTEKDEYTFGSMTTYELFWPIVAGKVPGDRFYNLKLKRDKLASFFFFDRVKKSEYLKQLANKRLIEAEKLVEIKRYSFVPQTLEESNKNLGEGLNLLFSAEETPQSFWLKDEYRKDFKKHFIILERMKEKVEGSQKSTIEDSMKILDGLIVEYSFGIRH